MGGQFQVPTSFLPIEYMFVFCLLAYFVMLCLFPGLVSSQLRTFHIEEMGGSDFD
jgi:hypothetical protein